MSKKLHVGLALGLGTLFLICCAVSCNTGDTDLSPGTTSPTAQQGLTSRETAYIAEFRENVDLLAGAISSLEILIQDPQLKNFPQLRAKLSQFRQRIHLE